MARQSSKVSIDMDPLLLAHSRSFGFATDLAERFTADLTPEELSFRATAPSGVPTNSIMWMIGHLTLSRMQLLRKLGLQLPTTHWEELVKRGAEKSNSEFEILAGNPEQQRIWLELFRSLGKQIQDKMESLTLAQLQEPLGRTLPDGSDTVVGLIGFLAQHESYHLGQIACLRVLMGRTGIS